VVAVHERKLTSRIDDEDSFSHRIAFSVKHLPDRRHYIPVYNSRSTDENSDQAKVETTIPNFDPHPWALLADFDVATWRPLEFKDIIFGPDGLVSIRESAREFNVINWMDGRWVRNSTFSLMLTADPTRDTPCVARTCPSVSRR
jgi:hypothetical protein